MQKNKWNQHTALEDLQEEPSYVEKDFKNVEEELVICSLVKKSGAKRSGNRAVAFRTESEIA